MPILISIFVIVLFLSVFCIFPFCVALLLLRTFVAFINKIIVIVYTSYLRTHICPPLRWYHKILSTLRTILIIVTTSQQRCGVCI